MFEWLGSVFMLRALRLCCKTQRVVRRARLVGWETIRSLLWHGDSRYDVIWLVINQQTTAQVLTPKYSIICCWIARCFYNKPISVLVLKINLSWSQPAISRNPHRQIYQEYGKYADIEVTMRAFSSLHHITGFSGLLSNLNGFGPTFTNESLSTFSSTTQNVTSQTGTWSRASYSCLFENFLF